MLKLNFISYIFLMFLPIACTAQDTTLTAQEFWSEFRAAVIIKDTAKLISMTEFPLAVHGVDDSQPVKQYGKAEFAAIFKQILNQPVITMEGDKVITQTTYDRLNATKELTNNQLMTKTRFRVDQLEFELKHKQWKLVRAYLEE